MRRPFARWLSVTLVATAGTMLVASCSSSSHPPLAGEITGKPTGGDASTEDEASAQDSGFTSNLTCTPADGGGGCNTLGFCTGQVMVQQTAAVAPTLSGGPPPSGLYAMTAYLLYTGGDGGGPTSTTGAWFKETMRFTVTNLDAGTTVDGGDTDGGTDGGVDASGAADAGASVSVEWQNYVESNTASGPSTNSGTVILSGNNLRIDSTCPTVTPNLFSAQYSSSASGLLMLVKDTKGMGLITYSKISN